VQAWPHAPQLPSSDEVSVQAVPQRVPLEGHVHEPLWHVCPYSHARPHAPQFASSEAGLMQTPPQSSVPEGQLHEPAWQVSPPVQT
jgi:hypothetical protein